MPGWEASSWGYHGDDGYKFHGSSGTRYAETWRIGDKIGCHVDLQGQTAHFSKNGEHLG